jgi:prevent-host-death family protein
VWVEKVTVRELRNNGGEVLNRVLRGETLQVTRDGLPVAEIVPTRSPALTADELIRRSRQLPPLDADRFRRDVDAVLDQSL